LNFRTSVRLHRIDYHLSFFGSIALQFAVLLSGNDLIDGGGCDKFGWVEIASLSVLGGAILLSLSVIALFFASASFRALIKGFDPNLKVSKLMAKANVPTRQHDINSSD